MKKLCRYLFVLTLSSTALSGCSLLGESESEAVGLYLKDYKTYILKGSEYQFDGVAYLKYEDGTEKDVTKDCIYPVLNTSVTGEAKYKVSYETSKFIYRQTATLKVVDHIELEKIEISDYSETVYYSAEDTYTFDGKVIATYQDKSTKDVTSSAVVTPIKLDMIGDQSLVVSYSENNITKSVTKSVKVLKKLLGISINLEKSNYIQGTEFSFAGKVMANYSDGSTVDVTSSATVDTSAVDIDTLGKYSISASYNEDGQTFSNTAQIIVSEKIPELVSIKARDYTSTVLKNKAYSFDGIVEAYFDNDEEPINVTAYCTFSTISTSTVGTKTLTITYTDTNSEKTKTATVTITVYSEIESITAPATLKLKVGATSTISATVNPSDAKDKSLTYTSSNTAVATVSDSGVVEGKSVGTAIITIASAAEGKESITATTTVTVSEDTGAELTVLLYMCGADLESNSRNRLATGDITEILSVAGQPDDVNFVIQTGGASSWASTYGISASANQRYHVKGKKLVQDNAKVYTSYQSMGLSSTLRDFVEWGIQTYPADRIGLILWNHGGAMRGVCYDEKKSDDSLLTNEVATAISSALSNVGNSGEKLEFVGYDACLMQVQDVASINADYFNYMIASEESEAGEGWDYDTWVDDLYAKKATPTILKAIVDGFIADNGGTSSRNNDQTLSFLNLSKMDEYVTAWNSMAAQLNNKVTSSNRSTFNDLVASCKYYADESYTAYGLFDAKDFINKLKANSTFNPGTEYTSAVLDLLQDGSGHLIEYQSKGKGAGNSYGLAMFWAVDSDCEKGTYYKESMTKFSTWRSFVQSKGY